MSASVQALREHERLAGARRFLVQRPYLVLVGAALNAACLAASSAPDAQKRSMGLAFAAVVAAFFAEAWYLARRPLDARWLFASLSATVLAIAGGAALSGGARSPLLPLVLAPTVVGFAAFSRARSSAALLALATLSVGALAALPPLFAPPPAPWDRAMSAVGMTLTLALLAVGVIGLVEAHARVAATLDRMRADVLAEAERRGASLESLGAQVAHEVKNPLTAARGLVQLVARRASDARDRERLEVVVGEVDRALEILHGYLDLARPITELRVESVELRALLEDVAGVLEARALERGIALSVDGERCAHPADRERLREAVLNLALNAIAALPAGGPLVLRVDADDDGTRLSVIDGGTGMSPELVAKLARDGGSPGLGVRIARAIARQHGGALTYRSAPGAGTTATLALPRAGGR